MPHVHVILDRSGSMATVRADTIKGFNEFAKEQPKGTIFSMTQFDFGTRVELTQTFKAVKKPVLTLELYQPRGLTPLLDAVGSVLEQLLESKPKGKVVVLIITDGHENSSVDYTLKQVSTLVEKAKAKKWQVVFMGADIDSYATAGSMGIRGGQTMDYAGDKTQSAYASVATASSDYLRGEKKSMTVDDVK